MNGLACFIDGFSLIQRPGLRRYFVLPIAINTIVLTGIVLFSYSRFDSWVELIMAWFPAWMSVLYWLIWGVALIVVLVLVLYVFTVLANIIASPFNAVLSAKVQEVLLGKAPISNISPWLVLPRALAREVAKLIYVLPRLIGLLILTIIPVVNTASPILWIYFGAWMMAIQYADYAADNNEVSFRELKKSLSQRKLQALMFGLPAYLLLTVPFVNLILMPVGVAGGTRFWVEQLKVSR